MRGCQTCTHSRPIFISSNIYTDGYSQTCLDCKAGRKDGYEPVYGEEPKKYIIELSENDYVALKEDGVQNHLALAYKVIANSMPYEERPKGKWIDTGDMQEYWAQEYQCSICGAKDHWHNFCPNCGADMRGGAE